MMKVPDGLAVRAGLHTGECEMMAGDLAGIAAHLTARVMAFAQPARAVRRPGRNRAGYRVADHGLLGTRAPLRPSVAPQRDLPEGLRRPRRAWRQDGQRVLRLPGARIRASGVHRGRVAPAVRFQASVSTIRASGSGSGYCLADTGVGYRGSGTGNGYRFTGTDSGYCVTPGISTGRPPYRSVFGKLIDLCDPTLRSLDKRLAQPLNRR